MVNTTPVKAVSPMGVSDQDFFCRDRRDADLTEAARLTGGRLWSYLGLTSMATCETAFGPALRFETKEGPTWVWGAYPSGNIRVVVSETPDEPGTWTYHWYGRAIPGHILTAIKAGQPAH